MGWWESESGDALGDGPADAFINVIKGLYRRPTFQGVLDAAAAALADVGRVTVADPDSLASFRLRARLRPPSIDVVSGPTADRDLVDAMCEFLFEAQEEYHFVFKRKPTAREVVRTMAFCLRGQADPYIDAPVGSALLEIVVERS